MLRLKANKTALYKLVADYWAAPSYPLRSGTEKPERRRAAPPIP